MAILESYSVIMVQISVTGVHVMYYPFHLIRTATKKFQAKSV